MYTIEQTVLDSIKKEMKTVLSRYEGKTDEALDSILKAWFKAKRPLLEMFSKHPNWNPEKLMIQFDADYSREFNFDAITIFRNYLIECLHKKHHTHYFSDLPFDERKVLNFTNQVRSQFFDSNMDYIINDLNRVNDNFKIRNNMKSSKAIGKICSTLGWDKFTDYNKEYAKLCDGLNPIKVKRHTVISLNPIDFLLMSNGNSWNSCHRIRYKSMNAGCFSSGTISYMLDTSSFVFYTVDASFNGKDIELEKKLQRQIFGYKTNVILQSRLYPQNLDCGSKDLYKDIREIVQKVISDCLEIPNLWVKTKNTEIHKYVRKTSRSTAYPDYKYQSDICNVSIHKTAFEEPEKLKLVMMGRQPICIKCGKKHSHTDELYCRNCS